jgi:hypothetical protein
MRAILIRALCQAIKQEPKLDKAHMIEALFRRTAIILSI